ncbi:MAG: hypothetical protein ACPGXK_01565 [Phycisphaerae bacterium]
MPTLAAEDMRDEMLVMQRAERRHEFLLRADTYLNAVPADHEIRLLAVREFLNLGLVTPATEILERGLHQPSVPGALRDVHQSLQNVAVSATDWNQKRELFTKNLAALASRGFPTDRISADWQERSDSFRHFVDHAGKNYVQYRSSAGLWHWLPHFGDIEAMELAQDLPVDIKQHQPGPYAFDGIGLGYYFRKLYEATRDTFLGYGCPLFVVEPMPSLLAIPFHLQDWTAILSDPRLHLFVGSDAVKQLTACLERNDCLPIPLTFYRFGHFRHHVNTVMPADAGLHQTLERFLEDRHQAIVASYDGICQQYESCNADYWAGRFRSAINGDGPPLRILTAVSRHTSFLQHSVRDIQNAVHALGHECQVLIENNDHEFISPLRQHEAIRTFKPDVFLILDHLRGEFDLILPPNLPLLTWDQDQLPQVFVQSKIEAISAIDFVAGFAIAPCARFGVPKHQLLPAIIPTCPDRFNSRGLTAEQCAPYACDVSFVSHASQTPKAFHDEERAKHADPHVRKLLDTLFEILPEAIARDYGPHGALGRMVLENAMVRCGIQSISADLQQRILTWYLWRLGDRIFRHEALQWAADWSRRTGRTLKIYGNGWDEHPDLAEFAAGPAENGLELITIYKASTINLQLMPAGFIHQRALEGLAAEGFFLTRMTHSDAIAESLVQLSKLIDQRQHQLNRDLLEDDEPDVQRALNAYLGAYRHTVDLSSDDLIIDIAAAAAVPRGPLAFSRFGEITFDSASSFEAKAEFYCTNRQERDQLMAAFRRTVVENFSYEGTMRRFLDAHATSLEKAAAP